MHRRAKGAQIFVAAAFIGVLLGAAGFGTATEVQAATATVVTVGSQQVTFSGTSGQGAVGSVGGYDILAFDFETGQGGMGGDVQMGTDASGNPTLSGNLEVVPASDAVAAAPTSQALAVTPGETLLDLDGSGNYVLVDITGATAGAVHFSYIKQSSVQSSSSSGSQGGSAPVDLTSSAQQVTAGNQQITFSQTVMSGAVGSVGGYDVLAFDLESGKGGMGGDVQMGNDASGNPTLSGSLEAVPASDTLAAAPTSAQVPATPGALYLATDSSGNYALIEVTRATPQTVWFSYVLQASVKTLAPPPGSGQGSGGGTTPPDTGTPPATGSGAAPPAKGVYDLTGNCISLPGSGGQGALGAGVVLTPMFSGQSLNDAAQNMELVLHVAVSTPTDVTSVSVQQTGQIGGIPWYNYLHAFGQATASDWPFSMQQTDRSATYQILIKSPTLTSAGLADPTTGAVELDWHFNLDSGCGSSGATQAGTTPPAQGTGTSSGSTPPQGTPASSGQGGTGASQGTSGGPVTPKTVALKIGSPTATVNGQSQSINGAPPTTTDTGRTMVPFRFIGQALGASVGWNPNTRTASYKLGTLTVDLTIGQSSVVVNGKTESTDAPAEIVGSSTLVPLRFVSQALGASVSWDAATSTVTIKFAPQAASAPAGGAPPSGSAGSSGAPAPSGAASTAAGPSLASQYECGSFAISTGSAGACSTEPWIKLGADGTYTWGSDQGTYQNQGGTVTFSGSLGKWGAATLNASSQLVFNFTENSEDYRIVYYPH